VYLSNCSENPSHEVCVVNASAIVNSYNFSFLLYTISHSVNFDLEFFVTFALYFSNFVN
jgi:hypothetical protein